MLVGIPFSYFSEYNITLQHPLTLRVTGQFSIQPAYHAQDLAYTFDGPDGPVPFPDAKDAMQGAIVSFVQTGTPKMADGAQYPRWGAQGLMVNVTAEETYVAGNGVNKTRCDWWASLDI